MAIVIVGRALSVDLKKKTPPYPPLSRISFPPTLEILCERLPMGRPRSECEGPNVNGLVHFGFKCMSHDADWNA